MAVWSDAGCVNCPASRRTGTKTVAELPIFRFCDPQNLTRLVIGCSQPRFQYACRGTSRQQQTEQTTHRSPPLRCQMRLRPRERLCCRWLRTSTGSGGTGRIKILWINGMIFVLVMRYYEVPTGSIYLPVRRKQEVP